MATPIYDPATDGIVYVVQPDHEFDCHQEQYDSDLETVSSASTIRTASTITSDQISDYFREAHGRTYAYDENLPLIYPIDDIEIQRHQMQHRFLRALVHGNYIGPVRDVLRPRADGSRPKILDIRTCSGDWAQDMATEFPHCDIVSIDVAPMTHHVPRSNISFEVYDLYAGIAEPDESFDYVSCRHVQLHVKEYDRLIFDLHRVLKPGGLITICEVENQIFESDQPPYKTPGYQISAPVAAQAIKSLRAATSRQGVNIDDIHHIHKWLQPKSPFWAETCTKYGLPASRQEAASKGYANIHREVVLLPVGPWHPDLAVQQAGILVSRTFSLAWKQLGPTLIENGASPEEANELCEAVIHAYQSPELRALGKYHMVYATRI